MSAQEYRRTNTWHFGLNNGISFTNNIASYLSGSIVNSLESQASICDTNGSLLFYIDNTRIRNKNHQIMQNGSGILVNQSCTQGSLIVPHPGDDSIYFLFTTVREDGFYYSTINIKRNGGLGEVTSKNNLLVSPVSEKLTSVKHANGRDYWIFVHGAYNNRFFGFLLTKDGLKKCPYITDIGLSFTGANVAGAMKFSNNGKHLAVACFNWLSAELFDFDNSTGVISNLRIINNLQGSYGIEFSSTNRFLYLYEQYKRLWQFDLSQNNISAINNTRHLVYDFTSNPLGDLQGLQLAPDNRIYMAMPSDSSLSVIQFPDSLGNACQFSYRGFLLNSTSQYGLPNFVTSYFNRDSSIDFSYHFLCPSSQAAFTAKFAASPQWFIRKQNSGANWSYSGNTITHAFDTGTFEVKLKSGTDSISKVITVSPTAELLIPVDTLKCQIDSIMLTPQNANWYSCIAWNDTLPVTAIAAKKTGMYKVSAWTTHGCKLFDTINVQLYKTLPDPLIKPMPDTLYFCKDKSVVLSPDSGSSFKWNDGLTHAQRTVDTTGLFYTHWIDSFTCVRNDTVRLIHFDYVNKNQLPDTVKFCKGTSVMLKSDSGSNFIWNDGHLNATRSVDTAGLFHSHWTDSNTCAQSDTTFLLFYPVTSLQKPLPDSITFCIGKAITLNPDSGSNFIWNDGLVTAKRVVDSAGVFFTAWNDMNGCHMADTILVKTYNVAKPTIQRTGDSLFASGNFVQWQWLLNNQPVNGAIQNRHKAIQNGWYKVWAKDSGMCIAVSDSVSITNVGINDIALTNSILIYPNPVTHTLHVEAKDDKLSSVMLINGTGQTVFLASNTESTININCTLFPKGIYFIQLTTTKLKTFQQKIIIR
jgi:hypothetical protein